MRRFLVVAIGTVLAACGGTAPADNAHPPVRRDKAGVVSGLWRQVGGSGWGGSLGSVVAVGPDDGWAVGSRDEGDPALMRWRGGAWRSVDVPRSLGVGSLDVVAASARGEVWIFGRGRGATEDSLAGTRAWRWNGRTLTLVWRGPVAVLDAAVMAGSHDVWVAGRSADGSDGSDRCHGGFLKHRTVAGWSSVALPTGVCLQGMSALSAHDIWAVGRTHERPVSMHWDGRTWSDVPLPSDVAGQQGVLNDVAAVSPTQVWAVGTTGTREEATRDRQPIVVRRDGHGWTSVDVHGIHALLEKVATDGRGGILVSGAPSDSSAEIFHGDGRKWTREHVQPGIWVSDLAPVPGSSQTIAVGACCVGYDEDTNGRIWMR